MTHQRWGWAALILVLGIGARGQGQPDATADVLTLDDAIHLALEQNRQLRSALVEVEKFDDRVAAARTRRLPSSSFSITASQLLSPIDMQFGQGVFGTYPGIGPVPATDTTVSQALKPTALIKAEITQPISQLYKIGLSIRQLEVGRDLAREQVRSARQSAANQVRRVYYGILQTQSALESAQEAVKLYRELDRVTSEQVAQGAALQAAGLDVKARLLKTEHDAAALDNPLATQKEELNDLLGRDLRTQFRVSPAPEQIVAEVDLETARRRALESRPEIREAELRLRQSEYDRRIKRAESIPDVSLAVSYFAPRNFGDVIPRNIATAGIQVSWEPFDWGRRKRELAEKGRVLEQARLSAEDVQALVLRDVNARHRRVGEARNLVRVSRAAQDAAREKTRVAVESYRQQAALMKDVLEVQSTLAAADHQYREALLQLWTAVADLEKAMGGE
jgi:outer membrane protein TolC